MKSLLLTLSAITALTLSSFGQTSSPSTNVNIPTQPSNFISSQSHLGDEKYENKAAFRKMVSDRNYPNGNQNFGRYLEEMVNYRNSSPQQLVANWNYVDASGNLNNDVGRASTITIDTINNGRFYVCTPHSGVWVTNDNGITYTPITESLPTQNTSCLVIDPSNTNNLYLATGTYQGDMPANSMGIFKTTDAGATWNATGLTFSPASAFTAGDLVINPLNTSSLLAATTDGLYRTFDSGTSWTKIISDSISSVRFKPGDTTMIYALGSRYYHSSNSGTTFTQISSGINVSFQWKYQYYLRTSAITPDVVYLFTSGGFANPNFNTKMYIHKSTDSGLTFSILDSLINEVAYQVDASQTNPDKFISGYWNVWIKENGSSPFIRLTQTNSAGPFQYMHADQRGISFDPHNDSTIYFCNDGGLYRTSDNGTSFQNITGNMQLAHLYDFAHSQDTAYKILVATLDVSPYMIGTNGIDQTFTQFVEGFATDMSPVNHNRFYLSHQNPSFTINSGASFYPSTHPLIINSSYYKNSLQYDACDENVCYFTSFNDVFKSTNAGQLFRNFIRTTYNPMNNFLGTPQGYVVSRANPQYIYVYYKDSVYVTTNGQNPMTNITGNLPVSSAVISHMVVDPVNENNVWISFSGYSAGNKVLFSSNAGQTWTNISAGLPNALVCQQGVSGALYAATDGGVFYIDNSFSNWQSYNTGLPNVIINSIDIQRNIGKLRVATFGRGVWESDLFQPTPANYVLPPVALFEPDATNACISEDIQMNNYSCGIVDSVQWIFQGGTPATSTDYSPTVSYSSAGTYSITLIAYNAGGSDTLNLTNCVIVEQPATLPFYEPVANLNQFVLPNGMVATDPDGDGNTWSRGYWTDGSTGPDDDHIYTNNFSYNIFGLEEKIIFPQMDLTGTINPKLFFYRSYAQRSSFTTDSLKIAAKMCGGTDSIFYAKGGIQLSTVPFYESTTFWIPNSPSQWALDSVDLTSFAGDPAVTITFINKGYNGQLLYIDEFRIRETSSVGLNEIEDGDIIAFPNPAKDQFHIRSSNQPIETISLKDASGRTVLTKYFSSVNDASIDISDLANGVYFLMVNEKQFKKLVLVH